MYIYTVLPSTFLYSPLREATNITKNNIDLLTRFESLPTHGLKDPFPRSLRQSTLDLASNNLICSVALTGVLALQAGRFWAETSDSDDEEFVLVEAPTPEEQQEKTSSTPTGNQSTTALKDRLSLSSDGKVKPLLQQRVQPS